jgi:hypothetical protein
MRLYHYVGPPEIAQRVTPGKYGNLIGSPEDIQRWIESTGRSISHDLVIATFVVDADGRLLIADRRSEHVACAGGKAVQCAGELTFAVRPAIAVVSVSNQSTGFCPHVDSWIAIAAALADAGIDSPAGFDPACEFRKCIACGCINLIKDRHFQCSMCDAALPLTYNVQ